MQKAKNTLGSFLARWLNKEFGKPRFPLCDFEKIRHEVKQCDVLLIEGTTRISKQIQTLTGSPWSHAALYIGRLHDIEDHTIREIISKHFNGDRQTQLILESNLGEGTTLSAIDRYKGDHIRICRPKGLQHSDAQEIISFCAKALGKPYDIRHIFDLLRLLLPWRILPRRWGSSIFKIKKNTSSEICSALIAKAFESVSFPILPVVQLKEGEKVTMHQRNPNLFTPKDFDYSPYFQIIKYPMFSVDHHPSYRKLPWTDEEVVLNDDGKAAKVIPEKKNH